MSRNSNICSLVHWLQCQFRFVVKTNRIQFSVVCTLIDMRFVDFRLWVTSKHIHLLRIILFLFIVSLRTGFSFIAGILVFSVAWVTLGQSSQKTLSLSNWKEFTVLCNNSNMKLAHVSVQTHIHYKQFAKVRDLVKWSYEVTNKENLLLSLLLLLPPPSSFFLFFFLFLLLLVLIHFVYCPLLYLQITAATLTGIGLLFAILFQIGTKEPRDRKTRVCLFLTSKVNLIHKPALTNVDRVSLEDWLVSRKKSRISLLSCNGISCLRSKLFSNVHVIHIFSDLFFFT